jgi:hypothetical protein
MRAGLFWLDDKQWACIAPHLPANLTGTVEEAVSPQRWASLRSSTTPRPSGDGDGALLGELVGVARQVEQGLPKAGLVGVYRVEVRRAIDGEAVAVRPALRMIQGGL